MFKTNLKIAWRNLVKDKQFTFLNVLGLSAGLACALLIFLWVNDELSYDKIFANDDRLYQLMENDSEESSGLLSDAVKQQIPGVEYAAAVAPARWFPQVTLSYADLFFSLLCHVCCKTKKSKTGNKNGECCKQSSQFAYEDF